MARVLRSLGYEVFVASDGVSALTAVANVDPDVVLLDIGLPKMNGFEVAKRLRQRTRTRPLLLIATTGLGQLDDRRRSQSVGFDHHLTKPIAVDSLIALLQHDTAVHAAH
jgi:CheY-like chemotaxis protein